MVQEVQQQGNWYQTPNRIQGIGVSERKVSDHTQVRNKKTNMLEITSEKIYIQVNQENFAHSWTYNSTDGIFYKVVGGDIYLTEGGAYILEYYPCDEYLAAHYYIMRLYADDKVVYQQRLTLRDHDMRKTTINLGRKNKLTLSLEAEYDAGANVWSKFRFIKL